MWRIGLIEFDPAIKQAKGRAICPFCKIWADMMAESHGDGCVAKYGRRGPTAIFCRVGDGKGGFRPPTAREMGRALTRTRAILDGAHKDREIGGGSGLS